MTDTAQTRKALSERLAELEARAERLMADLTEAMSADFDEQAVETEDDDALLAQETLIMQRIAAVRAAIARVDEGQYGICAGCGGQISPARLAAMPEATHCISCATHG
jgi:DnaK suppressor protein